MLEVFEKMGLLFAPKVFIATLVSAAEFLFGIVNHSALIMLVVLVIFDFITAIMVQYKTGQPIESRKALKTTTKLVVYGIFSSGGYLTEQIVPGQTFIDSAVISFLAITELISITENIGKLGFAIPKKLLNRLEDLKGKG